MTILLVILILAALLSISIGIFEVVYGEFRISGEITDSFLALYAADQGMEQLLYQDRIEGSIPGCETGQGNCSYGPAAFTLSNGSCVTLRFSRDNAQSATAVATGEYPCESASILTVKRSLQSIYSPQ